MSNVRHSINLPSTENVDFVWTRISSSYSLWIITRKGFVRHRAGQVTTVLQSAFLLCIFRTVDYVNLLSCFIGFQLQVADDDAYYYYFGNPTLLPTTPSQLPSSIPVSQPPSLNPTKPPTSIPTATLTPTYAPSARSTATPSAAPRAPSPAPLPPSSAPVAPSPAPVAPHSPPGTRIYQIKII